MSWSFVSFCIILGVMSAVVSLLIKAESMAEEARQAGRIRLDKSNIVIKKGGIEDDDTVKLSARVTTDHRHG